MQFELRCSSFLRMQNILWVWRNINNINRYIFRNRSTEMFIFFFLTLFSSSNEKNKKKRDEGRNDYYAVFYLTQIFAFHFQHFMASKFHCMPVLYLFSWVFSLFFRSTPVISCNVLNNKSLHTCFNAIRTFTFRLSTYFDK